MSIRLMAQVWDVQVTRTQQAILLAMADHANDEGKHCYPSIERLAWKTDYSPRQIKRTLKQLRDAGILEVSQKSTRYRPTEYRIRLDRAVPKEPFRGDTHDIPDDLRGDTGVPSGVTNPASRGDTGVPSGVTPVSPKPSVEPSVEPPKEPRARACGLESEFDFDDSAPSLSQKPTLDRTKLINGKVPSGMGETPAEVFFEIHPYSDPLSQAVTDDLVTQAVSDLGRWREAVRYWKLEGYKPGNIRGQLDWYHAGVPNRNAPAMNGASNGTHRRSNGFGRDPAPRSDPEPEFVPDEKILAGMERVNAIRNGRAPAGG